MSQVIVDLDGLTFNGTNPDSDGVYWYVTALDGWDSPETRASTVDPSSRHGQVLAKALLQSRAMTLTGLVKAPTEALFYEARSTLQGQVNNIGAVKRMTVTEERARWVDVYRAAGLRMRLAGMSAFTFELPLTAPDPLKYNVTPTTVNIPAGGTVSVTNLGDFPSENWYITTLSLSGGIYLQNETLSGTPAVLTARNVPTGAIANAVNRTLKAADGSLLYSSLSPLSQWFSLQPGNNALHNRGTTTLSFTYYSAWL